MNATGEDPQRTLRWSVYLVLIAASVGSMTGRLLAVNSVDRIRLEQHLQKERGPDWREQRPFLSANDRSRWCTVRALVEHGTYAIDEVQDEPNWDTIDMVKHDGHLYSSKPPLLATLMAGEYWLIYKLTGNTLGTHPYEIGRFMIWTINILPMAFYFVQLAKLIERFGTTDWGRMLAMAAAAFGTFLSTFAVTINNHLIAAVSAAAALAAAAPIWYDGQRRWGLFAASGFFAAFTAANELPALSFAVLLALVLLWKAPKETLLIFLPAAAVVAAAAEGTNYVAHGTFAPAYAHRGSGENWYDYTYVRGGKERDSYWKAAAKRSPVDRGEPSIGRYALHALVGHHGIFSLTPVWLLSLAGVGIALAKRGATLRGFAAFVSLLTITCLVFYLTRPEIDRNYGGSTSGLRWMFWFTPLWIVALLPAADKAAGCRWLRGACLLLLAFSALSASYPTWNPWTHPWLVNLTNYLGWTEL